MNIEMEFWQMIVLLLAFFGGVAGAAKVLLNQVQKHMDERFTLITQRLGSIETEAKKEATQWQRIEREMMELKAEMPIHYVRREDYVRGQSVIENKIDTLALKLENAQLRGNISGGVQHGEPV